LNHILSRLEEPATLTAAFGILITKNHQQGKTFPITQEVDKINLRSNRIPTKLKDLLELVDKIFERRNETLQLNNVYRQFVMMYGRIAFNPAEKFSVCYVHMRQP